MSTLKGRERVLKKLRVYLNKWASHTKPNRRVQI
jgi:hypothetical protein